jgi:hypothetical protein
MNAMLPGAIKGGMLFAFMALLGLSLDVMQVEVLSGAFGERFKITVSREDLLKCPPWKAESPNPPVSAAQAIRRATEALKGLVKQNKELSTRKWELESADLCFVKTVDRWFWRLDFEPRQDGTNGSVAASESLVIVVLMDGRVMKPSIEKGNKEGIKGGN